MPLNYTEPQDGYLYKLADVAKAGWLGVSTVMTIYRMIERKDIQAVNISRNKRQYNLYRINGTEIKRFQKDSIVI